MAPNDFGAQVVTFDRESCVLYKQALDQLCLLFIHPRVGGSPRISTTPPRFGLSAPFAFSEMTQAQDDCKAHSPWPGRKHRH